ncbi:tyrosine-type recombinase/integrase [Sphingomonas canadensis]|uniref:Tyrosine-type recombinase/integrase n=1 Tax=Sphingomonas canadensis TaxID=1219257 RepID=A0ABW3HBM8_9SPHN|nr:integrase arm-type DNA-binding domain-containing protein [Sphingomonas canadensis]MCW3837786.1 integrase arm-type DNA-binding domain-containing protein [Sphingomonas canadensis]
MLTDLACRRAAASGKPRKLTDSDGLFLLVTATGYRSWRFKYRIAGPDKQIEKQLVFGPYPEISLEAARARRDEARRMMRDGLDPGVVLKQRRAAQAMSAVDTFQRIAEEWHQRQSARWDARYSKQVLERLRKHAFPAIGRVPVRDVTVPMVLQLVRAIEAAGTIEMAHRVRGYLSDVFVFAIGSGRAEADPAAVIRKALQPVTERLRPAELALERARSVLAAVEKQSDWWALRLASRMVALTAARPGAVIGAAREEFEDLYGPEPLWRIPAARMKLRRALKASAGNDFTIPLSTHAAEVVKAALATSHSRSHLFPSLYSPRKTVSLSSLSKLYRDAGFAGVHVPHGWRSTFSTVMNELAAAEDRERDRAIIDLMLAHKPKGVEGVYNRSVYMARRRAIAQQWGDLLMQGLPPAAELLPR